MFGDESFPSVAYPLPSPKKTRNPGVRAYLSKVVIQRNCISTPSALQRGGGKGAKKGRVWWVISVFFHAKISIILLMLVLGGGSWRIHPIVNKWLMFPWWSLLSPIPGVVGPLTNGRNLWLINWGDPNCLQVLGWSSTLAGWMVRKVGEGAPYIRPYPGPHNSMLYLPTRIDWWLLGWWQLKHFFHVHPELWGNEPILTSIFFRWVETTT